MRDKSRISLGVTLATFCMSVALSTEAAYDKLSAKEQQREDKQEFILKKQEHCNSLTAQQTAALVAEDWQSLERLAKDYLAACKRYVSSQTLSDRAINILIADIELGRFKQALISADACIKIYYANPACHTHKAVALFAVGNKIEAIKVLKISDRLARHALDSARRSLEGTSREHDKKNYESSINYLESLLSYIDQLGSQWHEGEK